VIGIFPSDHAIKDTARFAEVVRAGVALAASGDKVVVLGVPPARAETGYGYIELGGVVDDPAVADSGIEVRRVKRFT
jgi:mannose-1-phosphate guanylyltransferase